MYTACSVRISLVMEYIARAKCKLEAFYFSSPIDSSRRLKLRLKFLNLPSAILNLPRNFSKYGSHVSFAGCNIAKMSLMLQFPWVYFVTILSGLKTTTKVKPLYNFVWA